MEQFKTCSKCKTHLPPSAFGKRKKSASIILEARCKQCINQKRREWYERNKERQNDLALKRYYRNKEHVLAKQKEFYANNKERILAQHKKYNEANKARRSEYGRKYRADNKEVLREKDKCKYQKNAAKRKTQAVEWGKAHPENRLRYTRKNHAIAVTTMRDTYIKSLIQPGRVNTPPIPQSLIEAKREQLKMSRITKELIAVIKEKQNGTK